MPRSRFGAAMESRDVDALRACLHPDVVFKSPVVFNPSTGRDEVQRILAAVLDVLEDFRYVIELGERDREILVFSGTRRKS